MTNTINPTVELMKTLHSATALTNVFIASAVFASELPTEQEAFQSLVAREIVLGATIEATKDHLAAMGFQCKFVKSGWTNNANDNTEYLFCSRQQATLVKRRWQVAVLPKRGKVIELHSSVGLVGP